jgi:signal transduction histidine kinase
MLPALRAGLARALREHPGRRFHGGLNAIAGVERMLLKQREETAARLTTALEWLSVLLALAAPTVGMVGIFLLLREGEHVRQRELQMQLEHSQRLRSFIQKHDTQWQPETCASLVADAVALLGSIDARVALNTDVQTGLPVVMVDRIQIQQVLVNLMRNAIEAMAASPRREMWLTVARADDGRVLFRLRDSGPGLAPQVAQRLFQPFTSTKEEGMGIGLSICRRILHDHGGDIWVESPADGGAAFCFALPVRA